MAMADREESILVQPDATMPSVFDRVPERTDEDSTTSNPSKYLLISVGTISVRVYICWIQLDSVGICWYLLVLKFCRPLISTIMGMHKRAKDQEQREVNKKLLSIFWIYNDCFQVGSIAKS